MPDLEERVAALEAALLHPLRIIDAPEQLTEEQAARFREEFEAAAKKFPQYEMPLLPSLPPLTPDQVRYLLRECVTVVKPGETLVVRGGDWTPMQLREIQRAMDEMYQDGHVPFRSLAVPGDELGAVQEPEFMSEVRADMFRDTELRAVRLTHLPTGVTVEAPTRPEAVARLGRALKHRGVSGAA